MRFLLPLLCVRSLARFLGKCILLLCHSLSFVRPYPKLLLPLPVAVAVVVLATATATRSTAVALLYGEMYVEEENTSARALKTRSRRMRARILKANAHVVLSVCLGVFARSAQKMDDERKGSSVINVSTSSFVQAAVVANLPVRMCVSPSPLAVRLLDAGRGENEGREYMCRGDGTPARGEQRVRERTREREKKRIERSKRIVNVSAHCRETVRDILPVGIPTFMLIIA